MLGTVLGSDLGVPYPRAVSLDSNPKEVNPPVCGNRQIFASLAIPKLEVSWVQCRRAAGGILGDVQRMAPCRQRDLSSVWE